MVLCLGQFLFACSTAEYYRFSAVKPEPYTKAVVKADPTVAPANNTLAEAAVAPTPVLGAEENTLEASTAAPRPVLMETKAPAPALAISPKIAPVMDKTIALEKAHEKFNNLSKAEKKDLKREWKKNLQQSDVSLGLKLVLAILLPPLAVYLHEGLGSRFWISILLTLLFWLPGVIFALLVVTDSI
jgi:uncharacterized membrane protein YqaE (UPF0057 family)